MAKIKYVRGRQLLPKPVSIRMITPGNYGYFYGDLCFAFVWAMRIFSKEWWGNLLFMADCDPQEAMICAQDRQRQIRGARTYTGGKA